MISIKATRAAKNLVTAKFIFIVSPFRGKKGMSKMSTRMKITNVIIEIMLANS